MAVALPGGSSSISSSVRLHCKVMEKVIRHHLEMALRMIESNTKWSDDLITSSNAICDLNST